MLHIVLVALLALLGVQHTLGELVPLIMLSADTYPDARCLDGSQAGYYMQPASAAENSTKWVIYLNGGGECDSESACTYQAGTELGSSKYFYNETNANAWFWGSDYCGDNPDFCTWNHAYDPYCTQDLHTGQRREATEDTWGLYFSGHLVLEAMLDDMDRQGLLQATEIMLTGASAGGLGVWPNLDYIAERYPRAKVTGATVAGHYFYATYYKGPHATDPGGMADFRKEAWATTYALYDAFVDVDCKAAMEAVRESPGGCILSNVTLPYVSSPGFVVQSQTDSVVLTGHDCWPEDNGYDPLPLTFMSMWHANMSQALDPLMHEEARDLADPANLGMAYKYGVFAAACYCHCSFTSSGPYISGSTYHQAHSAWYFQETNGASPDEFKLSDDCGERCNPTCV
jgi:ribosome maturation protein SDO1